MNDKNLMTPEERAMAEILEETAKQVNASASFKTELEKKLMNAHQPKTGFGLFSVKKIASTVSWTVGLAIMALIFIWAIRTIAIRPQPAAGNTPFPNVEAATVESPVPDNTFDYTVKEGDTCSFIAYKYDVTIKEIAAVNDLPSTCPITVGQVLKIPIKTNTIIPPQGEAYDWNGTKLYLNASLPDAPADANLYLAQPDQPASIESAKALARRFGIEGQVYVVPGELPDTTNYMVTAGGPRIYVRSNNYFSYYKNYDGTFIGGQNLTDDQVSTAIDEFLKSHGFNFEYQLEHAPQIHGDYYVIPKLDGYSLRHDYMMPARLDFLLDDNGQVLSVYGALLNTQLVGTYGIRSAEEAFQQILNNAQAGVQQSMHSGGMLNEQTWLREYPENEIITIYGEAHVFNPAETGQLPFITINGYALTGNTNGLESAQTGLFVEASGQFVTENGIRAFQVGSWKQSSTEMIYLSGFLHKDGDQVILTADDGNEYPLVDVPADAPLNTQPPNEQLMVSGIAVNGQLEWTLIQYFPTGGGGGGGGGGGSSGFYKLNLTGTPVPLPTPIPLDPPSEQTPSPDIQGFENLRGMLTVTIYNQTDGSQRVEYGFTPNDPAYQFMLLEGEIQELQAYHNRPVDLWGAISHVNENGTPIAEVENFEIPFPDLNLQILKGTEKSINIQDQIALLFTSDDGKSYVQLAPNCSTVIGPESVVGTGQIGEPILLEALIVPDLTIGGYPAICIFSTSIAIDPQNGQPVELTISADQPYVTDEPPSFDPNLTPVMVVEKVELVYYISDPRYETKPSADSSYVQPVWRFTGHYSNGDDFEFLVQALKDEFLLPEIQSIQGPG